MSVCVRMSWSSAHAGVSYRFSLCGVLLPGGFVPAVAAAAAAAAAAAVAGIKAIFGLN